MMGSQSGGCGKRHKENRIVKKRLTIFHWQKSSKDRGKAECALQCSALSVRLTCSAFVRLYTSPCFHVSAPSALSDMSLTVVPGVSMVSLQLQAP